MSSDLKHRIIKTVGYIPVILCLALFGWSYFAYFAVYLYSVLPEILDNQFLRILLSIISHILLVLAVWSFIQVVFVNPGAPSQLPPKPYKLNEEETDPDGIFDATNSIIEPHQIPKVFQVNQPRSSPNADMLSHLVTVKNNGEQRFCRKCDFEKPDRTHHCSMCGHCVLKMDHHCPWINNCVGFHNQKFFLLFIFYTDVYCMVIAATLIPGIMVWATAKRVYTIGEFQLIFLVVLSLLFGLILLCFTGYHIYLLLTNRTTIENMELTVYKADRTDPTISKGLNIFNVGYRRNFEEVMGKTPYLWFIPIKTTLGDGALFPLNSRAYNLLSARD